MFEKAKPLFQQAIEKSGYNYQLKFEPKTDKPPNRKKNRKRNILWFNPPFNYTVTTNVAKEFLSLIYQCFPKGNPFRKNFNRKTLKVSYSTTPNMSQTIASHNSKLLTTEQDQERDCNRPQTRVCPLENECINKTLYIKQPRI